MNTLFGQPDPNKYIGGNSGNLDPRVLEVLNNFSTHIDLARELQPKFPVLRNGRYRYKNGGTYFWLEKDLPNKSINLCFGTGGVTLVQRKDKEAFYPVMGLRIDTDNNGSSIILERDTASKEVIKWERYPGAGGEGIEEIMARYPQQFGFFLGEMDRLHSLGRRASKERGGELNNPAQMIVSGFSSTAERQERIR